MRDIVVTNVDGVGNVIPTKIDNNLKWSFSFQFFEQIELFGLDRSDTKWFISFLERLKDLSQKERAEIFSERNTKKFYKYHTINWNSKNVPIQRKDLNWVSKAYLENEDEYPFYQFKISKGNGRVIGFWNEDHTVFFIVLLDPLHNLQPSKDYGYAIDDCYPLSCEYSSLRNDIENVIDIEPNCGGCNIKQQISNLPSRLNESRVVMGFMDEDYHENYEKLREKMSFSEILKSGIISSLE